MLKLALGGLALVGAVVDLVEKLDELQKEKFYQVKA